MRGLFGALLVLPWTRPTRAIVSAHWKLILICGLNVLAMNFLMFGALQRIPVGIAVAIEFWGPMAIAVAGSRTARDFLWIGLAISGILLFTPLTGASLDGIGVLLAIGSGAAFASSLVFSGRLGRSIGGVRAAGMAMIVAAIGMAPVSLGTGLVHHLDGPMMLRLLLAAVLTNAVGMTLEFTALTRIRASLYAVLVCLEPAVGAVLALLLLGERLDVRSILGIMAVSTAALGATRTSKSAHV